MQEMNITRVDEHIHLIDLEPAGIENFIASYVLKGKHVAIVETGPVSTVQSLLSGLKELNVKPEDVKLWTQSRKALGSIAEMYGKPEPVQEERIIVATEGMTFDIGNGVKLKVMETLGHASHHLAYYGTLNQGIFVGDTAGIYLNKFDVVVPTTPSPFRMDIALASLEKLINLKPKVLYYSHFGKAHDAVEKLQAYANQLKLWAEIAKQGIEKGENLKAIRKIILESDMALQKAAEYIKNHPVYSKTVLNQSVEGVLKYVEKIGNVSDFRLQ